MAMSERFIVPGLLVRLEGRGTFKVAVILGWSDRAPDKARVCVWSTNQRGWSAPQLYTADKLTVLTDDDFKARRGFVVRLALKNLEKHHRVDYAVRGVGHSWPLQKPTTEPPAFVSGGVS